MIMQSFFMLNKLGTRNQLSTALSPNQPTEEYNVPVVPVRRRSSSSSSRKPKNNESKTTIAKKNDQSQKNVIIGCSNYSKTNQVATKSQKQNLDQTGSTSGTMRSSVRQELKLVSKSKKLPKLSPKPSLLPNFDMTKSFHERFDSLDNSQSSFSSTSLKRNERPKQDTVSLVYKKCSDGIGKSKLIRELKERHSQSSRSAREKSSKRYSSDCTSRDTGSIDCIGGTGSSDCSRDTGSTECRRDTGSTDCSKVTGSSARKNLTQVFEKVKLVPLNFITITAKLKYDSDTTTDIFDLVTTKVQEKEGNENNLV